MPAELQHTSMGGHLSRRVPLPLSTRSQAGPRVQRVGGRDLPACIVRGINPAASFGIRNPHSVSPSTQAHAAEPIDVPGRERVHIRPLCPGADRLVFWTVDPEREARFLSFAGAQRGGAICQWNRVSRLGVLHLNGIATVCRSKRIGTGASSPPGAIVGHDVSLVSCRAHQLELLLVQRLSAKQARVQLLLKAPLVNAALPLDDALT
jgi:hypothetical protein